VWRIHFHRGKEGKSVRASVFYINSLVGRININNNINSFKRDKSKEGRTRENCTMNRAECMKESTLAFSLLDFGQSWFAHSACAFPLVG